MEVTFQIPDELASSITAAGDLSRRALEAFGLEELRVGHITELELRKILGLERVEMDGFLKSHGIYNGYTLDEVNRQVEAMERLEIGRASCRERVSIDV